MASFKSLSFKSPISLCGCKFSPPMAGIMGAERKVYLLATVLLIFASIYLFLARMINNDLFPAANTFTDRSFLDCKCESRTQLPRYRRASQLKASDYLVSRLRRYEALHKLCASRAVIRMDSTREGWVEEMLSQDTGGCQYVVWIAYSGLGNRLLSIASAFVYALLTDRVLLVDGDATFQALICEPFPGSSWYLPQTFPRTWLRALNESSPARFGYLLAGWNRSQDVPAKPYSYVHLTHTYDDNDRRFFCSKGQELLRSIPWLFIRSNNYVIPGLHFLPSLRPELERLFPQRETAFHHLSRYLFHPSDEVWGLISRFKQQYLAAAEMQVGIQVRTFDRSSKVPSYATPQLLACIFGNNILPNITLTDRPQPSRTCRGQDCGASRLSVLVTSLQQHYYDQLRDMFLRHPTGSGQIVSVHEPSHELWQKAEDKLHDLKALAEMFLLSFSDELVTSAWSTFGYVAQSMAGLRPWILTKAQDGAARVPYPACSKGLSIEPCFHSPPLLDCEGRGGRDPGKILPYVRHCEDVPWGIKLFNS